MFEEYFQKHADALQKSLKENLKHKEEGVKKKGKDLKVYIELYNFIKNHIPSHFAVSNGKVRNKKHVLNKNCDLLIYHKWVPKVMDMMGGYVLSDFLYTSMSIESVVDQDGIAQHAVLTNALKTLYAGDLDTPENKIVPMYSILFGYHTDLTLRSIRTALGEVSVEKEIPVNHQIDMVCILDRGIIIKDWESGGEYKIVETDSDTLMWFYILILEYLDRDGKVGFDIRDYIKVSREYKEY